MNELVAHQLFSRFNQTLVLST